MIHQTPRRTLADIIATGYLDQYHAGPPPTINAECRSIDEQACREATCEHCGTVGLRYRAYHRPGSYLAFAVCPTCFHAEEF